MLKKLVNFIYSSMVPRSYQQQALAAARESRATGLKRGIVYLPPRSGKTIIALEDALRVVPPGDPGSGQIMVIVPNRVIRTQKKELLNSLSIPELSVFTTAEDPWEQHQIEQADIILTTYQFYNQNRSEFEKIDIDIDYLILDEAHHSYSRSYQDIIEFSSRNGEPKFILGLSIFPLFSGKYDSRPVNYPLSAIFSNNILIDNSTEQGLKEFIKKGYLSRVFVKRAQQEQFQELSQKVLNIEDEPEYNWGYIYKNMSQSEKKAFHQSILQEIKDLPEQYQNKPKTIVCMNQDHAMELETFFHNNNFINSAALISNISAATRTKILESFESGQLNILFVVDMLKEGYDLPEMAVTYMARPFYSRLSYLQHASRSWATHPDKASSLVIDQVWHFDSLSSYSMHTAFERDRQYLVPEGEDFFSDQSPNGPVSYINEVTSIAGFAKADPINDLVLAQNPFRKLNIHRGPGNMRKIIKTLNSFAKDQVELDGVIYTKKYYFGNLYWTFPDSSFDNFLKSFGLLQLEVFDPTTDLSITSKNHKLMSKYFAGKESFDYIARKIKDLCRQKKVTGLSLFQNEVEINFELKLAGAMTAVTIAKSDEQIFARAFDLKLIPEQFKQLDYVNDDDLLLTITNNYFEDHIKSSHKILKALNERLSQINDNNNHQNQVNLTENGINLTFILKQYSFGAIWTIPAGSEKKLIRFLQAERKNPNLRKTNKLIETDYLLRLQTAYDDPQIAYKDHKLFSRLNNELDELNFELNHPNILRLSRNDIEMTFELKKHLRGHYYWTFNEEAKAGFLKFLAIQPPLTVIEEQDLRITGHSASLFSEYLSAQTALIQLSEELRIIAAESGQRKITLTRNNVTILFVLKSNYGKEVWTTLETNKMPKFLALPKKSESLVDLPEFDRISEKTISDTNREIKFYQGGAIGLYNLNRELYQLNDEQDNPNVLTLTRNSITLTFELKSNHGHPVWAIPAENNPQLAKFLGLTEIRNIIEDINNITEDDVRISNMNDELCKTHYGSYAAVKKLYQKLKHHYETTGQKKLSLTANGLGLAFEIKKNGSKPVWCAVNSSIAEVAAFLGISSKDPVF